MCPMCVHAFAGVCSQTFKSDSVHDAKYWTPECFDQVDTLYLTLMSMALMQFVAWCKTNYFSTKFSSNMNGRWNNYNVGKRDWRVWVTALHVISVIQPNFQVLYIPEFDIKKKRNMCTFITYFQVILFTRAVFLHELRFFPNWINIIFIYYHRLYSFFLFFRHCASLKHFQSLTTALRLFYVSSLKT